MKLESWYRKVGVIPHPLYAVTLDGDEVECHEWDEDEECWLTEDGRRFRPTDLVLVSPPFDEFDTFYELEVPLEAISLDGESVQIVGWVACNECWESDTGESHLLVHCPVPVIFRRQRSLDAKWQS